MNQYFYDVKPGNCNFRLDESLSNMPYISRNHNYPTARHKKPYYAERFPHPNKSRIIVLN